ncbi:MAG: M56 family metallopeptidase [Oscillospiraceae bacterium]|nr:M56 family metallopeptidase [Oscillospiraceae bacterium]
MKQILITSTVLIGVILLLRLVLRRRVSKRLIYATWLLVALRLLIPFQFGQSEYSVATVTEKLEQRSEPIQQVQQNLQKPVAGPSREEIYQQLIQDYLSQSQPQPQPHPPTQTPQPEIPTSPTVPPEVHQQLTQEVEKRISAPTPMQILTSVWISGIMVMAGWFLLSNLIFLRRARRGAQSCTDVITPIPILISDNVSTPCLAGLFRPVIYLTPESAADPQIRDHVLTHELTHLKHADHIWAWVRCLCLCVYWFNPLVWIAAIASKRDCELACDEAALKTLGDGQRIAYGKTLLATVTHSPIHVFQAATAMSESKKQLKERVNFIVKKPKNLLIAAVCLILVVTITAGLVFTGCKSAPEPATPTTSTEAPEPTQPNPIVITPEMPTENDLLDLLHYSAQMVENNDTITLNSHWLVKSYLHFNKLPPEVLTISDDIITIKTRMTHLGTDATEDIIIYATFLALLAKQYPNDFTDMDIHYELTMGRNPVYYAFFYTGWKEAGYDSIKDYYAAVDAKEVEMPQNAFKIGYQSPYINLTSSSLLTDDIYDVFITQRNQTPDTTPPDPDVNLTEALAIAEDVIYRYMWYKAVGICCDFEPVTADMSQYLSAAQKEHYFNEQYRLSCCKSIEEVNNHIDGIILKSEQKHGHPDNLLFHNDKDELFLIVIPTEYSPYRNIQIQEVSDSIIIATADIFDEDGTYAVDTFQIQIANEKAQIIHVQTSKAPPHTHAYTTTVIAPTCTEEGYDLHQCSCGHYTHDNFTPKTDHTYTKETISPTCTEIGYDLYKCKCGASYRDNEKSQIEHTYRTKTVAATCEKDGYELHQCQCGESYKDNYTSATGHDYYQDFTRDAKSANDYQDGYCYKYCENCGHSYRATLRCVGKIDVDAVIAECETYAVSLGFTIIKPEEWNHASGCEKSKSIPTYDLYIGMQDSQDSLVQKIKSMIRSAYDTALKSVAGPEAHVIYITAKFIPSLSLTDSFSVKVRTGLPL